jgi:biopolymer transport protein TolR
VSLRRGRRHAELNAEINVVSLIDVMMLLLIIFMIAAPIMHGGVDVQLPTADAAPLDPNKSGMVITVTATRIYVDRDVFTDTEFRQSFQALARARGVAAEGVNVALDRDVTAQRWLDVFRVIQDAGITNIGVMTESTSGSRR